LIVGIGCIVEGRGEIDAVPVLLRRLAAVFDPSLAIDMSNSVIRVPRQRLVREGEVERSVELLARRIRRPGGIILLVDSDDDCPAQLGPALLARARAARPDIPVGVVLAKMEFEAWFIGAAESLRGRRGLSQQMISHSDPESLRAAKGWLDQHMPDNRCYSETRDQPSLTAQFSLGAARSSCPSFDKCHREVAALLAQCTS
jgi:hypothetical protein